MVWQLPTNFTVGNVSKGIDGVGSIFQYASYATNGWFGTGIVFMIFLISFSVSAMLNTGRAFASASFIALVFSVYFARIGAVNPTLPFILLIATIAGFFWAKGERGNY